VTPFPIEPKKKGEELMTGSIGDTLEHMLTQQYPFDNFQAMSTTGNPNS
jgi:hypothetical protein